MASYNGTSGNDTLDGSAGNVNDTLNGGLGDDLYRYNVGSGNDVITDTGGTDTIQLGDPLKLFTGWNLYRSGTDLVIDFLGQGRLTVTGQFSGSPVIENLAFEDGWQTLSFTNSLTAFVGSTVLVGTSSAEVISGNGGDDLIFGSGGNDTIFGGDGDDEIHGGAGSNTIDGGAGWDSISYNDLSVGVTVNLSGQTQNVSGYLLADGHVLHTGGGEDVVTGIEEVEGSRFADVFYGGQSGFTDFAGFAGNDTFHVGGGAGDAWTWSTVDYGEDTAAVIVNLSSAAINVNGFAVASQTARDGAGDTDTFVLSGHRLAIEGSNFNDYLRGQDGTSNYLVGNAGDDTIVGGAFADTAGFHGDGEDGSVFGAVVNLSASSITAFGVTGYAGGVTVGSNQARDSNGGLDTLVSIENAQGSDFADYLLGSSGDNWLSGDEGNDTLIGGAGNDTLDGGSGIDLAVFSGNLSQYTRTGSGADTYIVRDNAGTDGTDLLRGVERLSFADGNLALDVVDGHAGTTARILGVVFGPSSVANQTFAGIGLALLDSGVSYPDLMMGALTAKLGSHFSNADEVNLLYLNLFGHGPTPAESTFWSDAIDSGQFSQSSLAIAAAQLDLNASNVNLVGLTQTGLAYLPHT